MAATQALGHRLAAVLQPGLTIHLRGHLGAGKTELVRAILRALGYPGKVKSPTYTLVEHYVISSLNLYHFDFYRMNDPHEWVDAGLRDHFNEGAVCLVEWPERGGDLLPLPDFIISLEINGLGRNVVIEAITGKGNECLRRLREPI